MRRKNRPCRSRPGPPKSTGPLPGNWPAKPRPDHPDCSSWLEAAACLGRTMEQRQAAPCCYRTAEGSSNLAEVASSGTAGYSSPAEAGVEAEDKLRVGKVRHG